MSGHRRPLRLLPENALARLPLIRHDVLVLREVVGLSFAEIAQITGTLIACLNRKTAATIAPGPRLIHSRQVAVGGAHPRLGDVQSCDR